MPTNVEDNEPRCFCKALSHRQRPRFVRLICELLLFFFPRNRRLLAMLLPKPPARSANVTYGPEDRWPGPPVKEAETPPSRYVIGWGVAATAVVALLIGFWVAFNKMDVELPGDAIATATPDSTIAIGIDDAARIEQLPDGSIVSVDAGSMLRIEFTAELRDVQLFEGKATFDVAEDTGKPLARPFRVKTLLVDTTTITPGAKFRVAIDTSVFVDVYEGAVELSRRGAKAGAPSIKLKKGQRLEVRPDEFRGLVADASEEPRETLVEG